MKFDDQFAVADLNEVPSLAKAAEDLGFDTLWTLEGRHDGLLPLALAAVHTEKVKLGTAAVHAFPHSPMSLAMAAWDLALASKGRFILGLSTQVKGHMERRYSVPWLPPVPRMREYIESLRAIFQCWEAGGKKLSYQGKYYNFSLMTPFFTPPRHEYWKIPIHIGGINKYISRLAGELCDGFLVHPLHGAKYLREHVIANIEIGLKKAGRRREDISVATAVPVIVGRNDEERDALRKSIRNTLAFYSSTRTYKAVLDSYGWGDVTMRLNELSRKGDWASLPNQITDEMIDVFAVSGTYDDIADKIKARYEGLLDHVSFYHPHHLGMDQDGWRQVIKQFNG
jgi:probable F420-dependent oxidoreductase